VDEQVAVWVVALAGAPGLVALVLAIVLWVRLRRVRADQRVLLPDGAPVGLVERQASLARAVDAAGRRAEHLQAELARLAAHVDGGLRGVVRFQGIVRYDAYQDMGGAQSWSLALVNAERTGAVITSLHARDHARTYLKEIREGTPSQRLSPEEERALAAALAEPLAPFVPGAAT
jgi:hypothetical protein